MLIVISTVTNCPSKDGSVDTPASCREEAQKKSPCLAVEAELCSRIYQACLFVCLSVCLFVCLFVKINPV